MPNVKKVAKKVAAGGTSKETPISNLKKNVEMLTPSMSKVKTTVSKVAGVPRLSGKKAKKSK